MATLPPEDQMKMMVEDFNRLQNQLLDLRTQNYEIENKLRKSEAENSSVHEKCAQQEKEIQKLTKLMKFPGFQAITKTKSKKDLVELIEENERLNQQMQRHEDDFKLQNQTLLQEVSRLSMENDSFQNQLESLKVSAQNSEELQRLEAENVILNKTVDELKQNCGQDSGDVSTKNSQSNTHSLIDELQKKIESEIVFLLGINSLPVNEIDSNNTSEVQNNNGEIKELSATDHRETNLKAILEQHFNELKSDLGSCNTEKCSGNTEENKFDGDENNRLRQQLASVKESSKKEMQQLREEVTKWTEKAKKKQESFVKLQEEKEKMYEEYRKEVEAIKSESASSEDNINRAEDLREQLNLVSKKNESLQDELMKWREKKKADDTCQIAELESTVHNLNTEKELYVHQIEKLSKINETYERNNQSLNNEVETMQREVEKNSELAERRKCLLDKNALERQQDIETHQKKMEEVKERHNKEMEELVEQKNYEIDDLKTQISSLKKIKKELDENNKKFKKELDELNMTNAALNEKLLSAEKKTGWLERTLSEEQDNCKALKEKHEQQINEMTNTFLKEKDEQQTIYQAELSELEKSLKHAKVSQQEHDALVEKLKQSAKDHEIELAISKKKNDQLIKDLKRQLTAERKKADQLSVKLQDFIQEIKVKQTYDEIFNPESLQMKLASSHKRQDSGSHISNVSSINENDDSRSMKTSSPVESTSNLSTTSNLNLSGMPSTGLSDETMDLISRYADLQQEKWMLEERVRHLEETGAAMADDVMQKSLIIQHYVMEKKADTPPGSRKMQSLKEKMIDKLKQIGTEELNREMSNKMQRILEETLATNVQLQKDLDLVTAEIQQLKTSTNAT